MKIISGLVSLSSFTCILKKFFLGFTLCIAFNIAAQEDGATIYHLEGPSFAVTVRGERRVLRAEDLMNNGIILERSGIVHIGAGTFLEIQLVPSGTVIKMSENTSLVYNGVDATGGFVDLGLLYGRIRVITGDKGGTGPVVVRSGGVSSRIEAGDFGADYILEPGGRNAVPRPLFRVHVFRGGVELFPYGRGGPQPFFGEAKTLTVTEGESLLLDISSSFTFAEKNTISREAADYWILYNFEGAPPLVMPVTDIIPAGEKPADSAESDTAVPFEPPASGHHLPEVTGGKTRNIPLIAGLALAFTSAAVQAVTYHAFDIQSNRTANAVFTASQIPLGVGLIMALGGLFYNPPSGKK